MITASRPRESPVWTGVAAVVGLHAVAIFTLRSHATLCSCLFLILVPLAASLSAWRRVRLSTAGMRRYWLLVGSGLLLWSVASIVSAYEQLFLALPGDVGAGSQILYLLYGVPLLLAIGTPVEHVWSRSFVWLDGLQTLLLGLLTYILIFSVIPFRHEPIHPVQANLVVLTFNVENLILVAVALLRFVSSPPDQEQRDAHRGLFVFVLSYAALAALYNHLTLKSPGPLGFYDLLIDLPFLYFAGSTWRIPRNGQSRFTLPYARTLSLILENASPVLFPTAILAMSIAVARKHFGFGLGSVAVTLLLYAVRSSILQIRFQQGQMEARRARDYMELLSLTDALTGVPNRRRFDDLLASEQNRMSRQQHSLSLLLIDIDYFKLLNDRFGHPDGDICLRQVAHALQATLRRESDALCRFGGEEFACLLPGTDRAGAELVALRMQATIRGLRLRTETPLGNIVTVSVGVTSAHQDEGATNEQLLRAADRALYLAKQRGRDRIEYQSVTEAVAAPVDVSGTWRGGGGLSFAATKR